MNPAWMLTFAALVPFLCLGLLLWLARLEDTLVDGLDVATATPEPASAAGPAVPPTVAPAGGAPGLATPVVAKRPAAAA